MKEMGYEQHQPTIIHDDSDAAINATRNPVNHSKFKHIDTKYHVIRDYIEEKQIDVTWISGTENLADLFTKTLPPSQFRYLRDRMANIDKQGKKQRK